MQIDNDDVEVIQLSALDIEALLQKAKAVTQEKALLDNSYRDICKQITEEGNVDKGYAIKEDLLCYRNRIYIPNRMRPRVIKSEHDSKVAGHFARECTMELISKNLYWPDMERDIPRQCNKCDICQMTKAPRHAKQGLLHPLELPCKPWTHISTDFITDLPESEGARMILVVVDRFSKMAHFIPTEKKDSPTVARTYLDIVWKYHGFPEDVVSDKDSTFSGSFFTDRYS